MTYWFCKDCQIWTREGSSRFIACDHDAHDLHVVDCTCRECKPPARWWEYLVRLFGGRK